MKNKNLKELEISSDITNETDIPENQGTKKKKKDVINSMTESKKLVKLTINNKHFLEKDLTLSKGDVIYIEVKEQFSKYVTDRYGKIRVIFLNPTLREIEKENLNSWKKWGEVKGLLNFNGNEVYVFDGDILHKEMKDILDMHKCISVILLKNDVRLGDSYGFDSSFMNNIDNFINIIKNSSALKKFYNTSNLEITLPSSLNGKKCKFFNEASEIQSILFDINKFDLSSAKSWLKDHGYKYGKVDTTENYHRFRQLEPDQFDVMRVSSKDNSEGQKALASKGIKFIFGVK